MEKNMTTESPLKKAICQFKQKGISIKKESNNPFFKSKYADLPTILDAIEVEAAKCGLVLISKSKPLDDSWVLETILSCKDSEETETSTFPLFGNKAQEIGSSITYARRYNIQSLLNLAADDDDGNEANNSAPIKKQPVSASKQFFVDYYRDLAAASDLDSLNIVLVSNAAKKAEMLDTYKGDAKAQVEADVTKREQMAKDRFK